MRMKLCGSGTRAFDFLKELKGKLKNKVFVRAIDKLISDYEKEE